MGIRASSTTTVSFDDVRVPAENVLGEVGKGFKVAMAILNNGRTGLGGGAVGGMKALIRLATRQAQERRQFGKPIAEFGLVREKIAQMTVDCFAAESAVWMVAHYIDAGCEDYSVEAAISKVFASEAMQRAATRRCRSPPATASCASSPTSRSRATRASCRSSRARTRSCACTSRCPGLKERRRVAVGAASGGERHLQRSDQGLRRAHGLRRTPALASHRHRRGPPRDPPCAGAAAARGVLREVRRPSSRAWPTSRCASTARAIADKQYLQKRIADLMIDLFVGLCVLSRADSLVKADPKDADTVVAIATAFTRQARRRMNRNVRSIGGEEDKDIEQVAKSVLERGAYPWDVM